MADVELRLTELEGRKRVERRVLANRFITTLSIPGTPPSYNDKAMARGAHWSEGRKVKRDWEANLSIALMERGVPRRVLRVEATALLLFATRARRDSGNFRVLLEKALGDCLTAGDWLPDDTPDRYEFGRVAFGVDPIPTTLITVTYYREDSPHGRPEIRRAVRG